MLPTCFASEPKWFCGFDLTEITPDFTVFTKFRSRLGTQLLSEIFTDLKSQLQKQGLMSEVFTFVDATHLISKAKLWEERDKALALKYEKRNNEVLPKVAHDKQARIGAKGKNKYWYGYKQHTSVDMQSGLINKIIHVNQYASENITVPFGGVKESGNGRDKSLHALEKYTNLKTVWLRINN